MPNTQAQWERSGNLPSAQRQGSPASPSHRDPSRSRGTSISTPFKKFARSFTSPPTSENNNIQTQSRVFSRLSSRPEELREDADHTYGESEPSSDTPLAWRRLKVDMPNGPIPHHQKSSLQAEVTSQYHSEAQIDLNLEVGQIIHDVRVEDRNWYSGSHTNATGDQRTGIFPRSNVRLLETSPVPPRASPSDPSLARSQTMPTPETTHCGANCALRRIANVTQDFAALQPTLMTMDRVALESLQGTASSIFTSLKAWQTRIIVLKAGSGNSRLCCDLKIVELIDNQIQLGCAITGTSQVVQYAALSYSWISDKPTARVTVNGNLWAIAVELANALLHLRNEDKDIYLWCDALCINQQDSIEKAFQIRNMLRIFEKAEKVIGWLGVSQPASGQLVAAFEMISPNENLVDQKHDDECFTPLEGLTAALRFHLSSQWFLRTWVRQEVFAAKELILRAGGHDLKFELFNEKLDAIHTLCNPEHQHRLARRIERPGTLDVLQREFQHHGTDRFDFTRPNFRMEFSEYWLHILSSGPLFGITEERDRIYGSLGILTSPVIREFARLPGKIDGLIAEFPVSYEKEKPLGEVFGDVTKFLIDVTGMANVLDYWKILKFGGHPCESLASWAIDWRYFEGSVLPSVLVRGGNYERTNFLNQPKQGHGQSGQLRLRGVRLTTNFLQITAMKTNPEGAIKNNSNVSGSDEMVEYSTLWLEEEDTHFVAHITDLDVTRMPEVTLSLQRSNYCLAEIESPIKALLNVSRFVVSRNVQLRDIIVSFYGSQYLHIIRPQTRNKGIYQYLGPILAIDAKYRELKLQQNWSRDKFYQCWTIPKHPDNSFGLEAEVFDLM